ncbi:MAG: bifunctional phosphopantothenoylcysteine decarboxylase/phosphopantothenate--cysteine ligase CoaBC [Gammaproteobacteria bacterium]|nr:bifunctional phosphopantothenoylcysteine decarboxylase/phosphopantothenate--cysteine ligase CoaBC [Gammaproteobacteria bacterium]
MAILTNRRILLGIGGSVAAYKGAEVVRLLAGAGAEVRVVLTAGGARFITPLTLQALSGRSVHEDMMDPRAEAAMGHIELARWADLVLIAPASANLMARLAAGMADDLLTTACLATAAPLMMAPAMNRHMWAAPATQANLHTLGRRGVSVLGPATGDQACGDSGPGRMVEAAEIVAGVERHFGGEPLTGLRVMVTAGPTREALDPVRYLSNRSSGRMGFAVAEAARRAGAEVVLVAGPVALATPPGVERVDTVSAADMLEAVMANLAGCDIFIAAAAVADYRPAERRGDKIKKGTAAMDLALEPTPDILATVAMVEDGPFTVGFAAETRDLERHARDKLERKGPDLVAANLVGDEVGFDSEHNALTVYWRGGSRDLGRATKRELADGLITLIVERMIEQG